MSNHDDYWEEQLQYAKNALKRAGYGGTELAAVVWHEAKIRRLEAEIARLQDSVNRLMDDSKRFDDSVEKLAARRELYSMFDLEAEIARLQDSVNRLAHYIEENQESKTTIDAVRELYSLFDAGDNAAGVPVLRMPFLHDFIKGMRALLGEKGDDANEP